MSDPIVTIEEEIEQQIYGEVDYKEIIKRDENELVYANIICTAIESETLNKRVTSMYLYSTLTEKDGSTVIGRQLIGMNKVISDFGVDCGMSSIQIVGSIKRGG
jgi:hypothetical protein